MSVGTVEIIDKDLARAGLIQQIMGETEIRYRQGEAQQRRLELGDELKAMTSRINQEIRECDEIDRDSDRLLTALDKAKGELLRSTAEGKQIRSLQAELKVLALGKEQVPQLNLLRHQVELAIDQGKPEEAGMLRGRIANLASKLEQLQLQIDSLWSSFGFEADTLRRV